MTKIYELKEHLTRILNDLNENYNGNEDLDIVHNTYWIQGNNFISIPGTGFLSLSNPTGKDEDDDDL